MPPGPQLVTLLTGPRANFSLAYWLPFVMRGCLAFCAETLPHLTSPHLTSPQLSSAQLSSSHLISSHLISSHLISSHFSLPLSPGLSIASLHRLTEFASLLISHCSHWAHFQGLLLQEEMSPITIPNHLRSCNSTCRRPHAASTCHMPVEQQANKLRDTTSILKKRLKFLFWTTQFGSQLRSHAFCNTPSSRPMA